MVGAGQTRMVVANKRTVSGAGTVQVSYRCDCAAKKHVHGAGHISAWDAKPRVDEDTISIGWKHPHCAKYPVPTQILYKEKASPMKGDGHQPVSKHVCELPDV